MNVQLSIRQRINRPLAEVFDAVKAHWSVPEAGSTYSCASRGDSSTTSICENE